MRTWAALVALILAIPPILGAHLGSLAAWVDALGVALVPAALAAVVASVLAHRQADLVWLRRLSEIALIAAAVALLRPLAFGAAPEEGLLLVQHNLLYDNPEMDLSARLAEVDMATLQEVRDPTALTLPDDWARHHCDWGPVGGPVVASRYPLTDRGCLAAGGAAWARVETDRGPVTLVSVHLRWPWPIGHADQVAALAPDLAALPAPILVGGDFNHMRWSHTLATLAQASGTRPLPGWRASYVPEPGLMRLRIDHVMTPPDWRGAVTLGEAHGSDHRALIARVAP